MVDAEIAAMAAVLEKLEGLPLETQRRILEWVAQRLGIDARPTAVAARQSADARQEVPITETFADLFERTSPALEKDKALVAGYWLQVVQGAEMFGSEPLNYELKHVGHGLKNVTDCLSRLISEKPQLVLQLRKSGSSRQARKTYKLTQAGIRKIETMLHARRGDTHD